jgi:tetratricopeptide (TPR) repeat protein
VFFDGLIQKSVLDLFFTCTALALIAALIAGTPRPRGTWMALGVTIAALSLTRENALLFAVVIMAWAATRRAWQGLTVFVAGMMLLFLPVVARNALVGGGFYLTTSQLGSNFFIGNNSEADGTYMSLRRGRGSPEFEMLDAKELAEQAVGRALTPAEVSSYWLMRSFDYIQTDPTGWLKLMGRKAALLVNASEMIDTESLESHAEHSLVLRVLRPVGHFGVLLPLALIGTVVAWPQRRGLWIVYVLAVTYAMGVVAFFVMARYRHPLLAFLALFGGLAVAQARELIQAGSRRQLATAAALALAAVLVANQSMLSETLMRAITEHNLGTALQEEKRFDEAITHYQRAIALEPTYGPAFNNLGTALMGKGDIASAVAAFRESYRLQPSSGSARELLADATYDAGVLLLERNDYRAAENALRESLMLEPDSPEALNNLGIALASQGRIDEAVLQWQRALAIKPDLQNARENLERARELQQSKR